MAQGWKTTEFGFSAVAGGAGLALVGWGAALAVEGARADRHELAVVGLGLCAIGAGLVAVLAIAYAGARGRAKAAPARLLAGRL